MKRFSVQNMKVDYCGRNQSLIHAVNDVSFELEQGESVGIIGESGSGKSTMMHAVLGLLAPDVATISGHAFFDGVDLLNCDEQTLKNLRWKEIAVVFQKSMNSLSPIHTIGTQFEDIYAVHCPNEGKESVRTKICELFELVNLSPHIYNMYPFELSGGMQQRLNIALSLMFRPSLLIMDEATTALDVITQSQILDELLEIEKQISITRIMITHDISVVASSCNKILVMYAGKIVEGGPVKEVIQNPKHPYTQGLVNSFPTLYGKKEKLKSIPGVMPNLSEECRGCIFAPRCEVAAEECFSQLPKVFNLNEAHFVACHKYK